VLKRFNTQRKFHHLCCGSHGLVLLREPFHRADAQVVLTGSWWSVLLVVPFFPLLVWRILDEENFLRKDLPGYAEYMERVRYRLVPCVWYGWRWEVLDF
jgi:protein-S-isoprenylcysteine O-methyltransferase Ste14